jgi:hypothetical protein
MSRTTHAELGRIPVRLISLEDLAARAARLVLDLAAGEQVEQKHASDYLRIATLVDASQVECLEGSTQTYGSEELPGGELIAQRSDSGPIEPPDYSRLFARHTRAMCPRCLPSPPFEHSNWPTRTWFAWFGRCSDTLNKDNSASQGLRRVSGVCGCKLMRNARAQMLQTIEAGIARMN